MEPLKKELVSVRIPKELNKKLTEHVAAMGLSKTAFILNLINKELANSKKSLTELRRNLHEQKPCAD